MKYFYFFLVFFSINCYSQDEFITVWRINENSIEDSITIPITENSSSYTYTWQKIDENYNAISEFSTNVTIPPNNGPITIPFDSPGIYRIKIATESSVFRFDNSLVFPFSDLINIEQWGNINWSSFAHAFQYYINLDIVATDIPNLSNVNDLSYMFAGCTSLNYNSTIGLWNVENITTFESMFQGASLFNEDIQNWNTSNATNFSRMFASAQSFNQPIGNWNTSNVTDFSAMFLGTQSFNQYIGDWNTSSATTLNSMFSGAQSFNQYIGDWNVSNVTNFGGMFHVNPIFNQPLKKWQTDSAIDLSHMFCAAAQFNQDVSNFNVTQATNLSWFVSGALNFNQSLEEWQLDSITDGTIFFNNSGIDCTNFTNTILGWSTNTNLPADITLGINNMEYSNSLIPTLDWFTNTKNWVFQGNFNESEACSLNYRDLKNITIQIYPNPTTHFINIEGLEVDKVDIYDIKGSLVQKTLNNNQVDISNLSSGNYILIINDKHKENIIKK